MDDKFVFIEMSDELNAQIIQANGEVIQKVAFPTDVGRSIQVYIYSGDHLPIHFHVKSKQRYLDVKFQLDPLKMIENASVVRLKRDEAYILDYFSKNQHLLKEIGEKFKELNPYLKYD